MTDELERKIDIAIVGATGLVGGAVMELLVQHDFPYGNVYPLASPESNGTPVDLGTRKLTVHDLHGFDFSSVQVAFFCVPAEVALEFVPVATSAGCIVIDHSSAYRADKAVPLVVADFNSDEIADYTSKNIIACPDSSVAHALLVMGPLMKRHAVERISLHAMRAVSEYGMDGVDELSKQSIALFNLKQVEKNIFPVQIAFNVIPAMNGISAQECELVDIIQDEIEEIVQQPDLTLIITAVQVPVFFGHSYCLAIEFKENIDIKEIHSAFKDTPGLVVANAEDPRDISTVVTAAAQSDWLYIDQIKLNRDNHRRLDMWLAADNIRCGVARNSIQIAEILVKGYL